MQNIFMGIFQETRIYRLIKGKVKLFLTYIDKIFLYGRALIMIHNNSKISKINEMHLSVKFDSNWNSSTLSVKKNWS